MSTTLKQFLLVSSIYLFTPAVDAFNLNDSLTKGSAALSSATQVKGETQQLIGQLQSQLGVTQSQAAGGTGAMLQLAKNQLGADTMSRLSGKATGLASLLGGDSDLSKGLLSNISSLSGVQSAFSALGMDPAMIQQFLPIVLGFLGEQGVGSSLLGQLQGLWTPAKSQETNR